MHINQSRDLRHWILSLTLAGSLLLFAVCLFLRLHIIPFFEIEIGGIEINVIEGIMKILNGDHLYTDPARPPYDIIQYSPLYYYTVAGVAELFGISPEDPQNIYQLTRYVALFCNLFTMIIVFLIGRHFRLTNTASVIAALFSFIYVTQHYYSRGDSMYCLLFFAATFFFLRFIQNRSSRPLIIFTVASFLCIMTKQSGIIVILSAGLYLLLKKDFKSIIKIAAVFIFMILIFVLTASAIGGLENFYRNVILGVKNGMSFFMYESFINDKYFLQTIFWVITGFILGFRYFKVRNDAAQSFLLLFILSSLMFAFITGLKIGSSLNYFNEVFTLTIIAAFIYIRETTSKIITVVFCTYLLFSIVFRTGGLYSSVNITKFRQSDYENYVAEKAVSDFLKNDLRLQKDEFVYVDYRGFTELFLTGNSIFNQKDFNWMVHLHAYPEIDFTSLINGADNGLIKYIISRQRLDEIKLLGNPFRNFTLLKSIAKHNIYIYNIRES